jgi:hypothetical protein
MSNFSSISLRTAVTLAGLVLTMGLTSPAQAQTPKEDLARCQVMYSQWLKYNGASSYSKNVGPEMALEDCRRGDTKVGLEEMKQLLTRNRIPLPDTETATTK